MLALGLSLPPFILMAVYYSMYYFYAKIGILLYLYKFFNRYIATFFSFTMFSQCLIYKIIIRKLYCCTAIHILVKKLQPDGGNDTLAIATVCVGHRNSMRWLMHYGAVSNTL